MFVLFVFIFSGEFNIWGVCGPSGRGGDGGDGWVCTYN